MSHRGNAIPFLLNPQTTFVIFAFIFMHKPPLLLNHLKPTGPMMHHNQFNIQQLYALPTLYL
jgi:hypothetical protein